MTTQKLVLDKSKWICGQPEWNKSANKHMGKGLTKFLNEQGYMCCLGQFSKQLNSDVTDYMLMGACSPHGLNCNFGVRIDSLMEPIENGEYINSELASQAITINDSTKTTVNKKIKELKELFSQYNYEIEVVN
jgi:hypothetical protein